MCDHDHDKPFTLESRRSILLALGIGLAGSVATTAAARAGGMRLPGMTFAPTSGIDLINDTTAHALPQPLVATRNDILGPFWRAGAPLQSKIIPPGAKGQVLKLSGTVMDTDGKPVPDVIIEIWNSDADGAYDLKIPGQALDPSEFKFRGLLRTDAAGHYEVETVVPGKYKVPPNLTGFERYAGVMRPSHIHLMTSHDGTVPLVTQIYFEGDPEISKDPWAANSKNVVALDKSASVWQARFDVVLLRFA
jgi:catechol 1,2-dioxygenase